MGDHFALVQKKLPSLKAKLTKAKKSDDPKKVIACCDEAITFFEANGYPDCWHLWQSAKVDALVRLRFLK